jgi:alpha-L-rhamnosidase
MTRPDPALGVVLHAIGGLASASFYLPFRGVKHWSWESYWLVGGVFSWVVAPWTFALLQIPDLFQVLGESPPSALVWSYLFGVLWGIGGLTFGLTMRYLGIALGMAMALGYCAAFGTLMPPLFRGELEGVARTASGATVLFGVVVCLAGIVVSGLAGRSKERELTDEQKQAVIHEFSFGKGVLVATISGILSACMSYGFAAGKPIAELAIRHGAHPLWQNLPVLVVVLAGGLTTNLIWCLALNARNGSGGEYTGAVRQDGSMSPVSLRSNYFLCATAGTIWYLQFLFYGMGNTLMGRLEFSSWTLHMASIMIFGTVWGLVLREWKGAGMRTRLLNAAGLFILVSSTVIVGYGNYLSNSAAASLPEQGRGERTATLSVADLRCEYLKDPLGIDARAPRLSWKLVAIHPEARNLAQSAYQVIVASTERSLDDDQGDFWDSGKVFSDQSVHVAFSGKPLPSHADCRWKVRVWDQDGVASGWSPPAQWSMGLLDPKDWSAHWIGWDGGDETDDQFAAMRAASWIWYPGGKPTVGAPIGTRFFRRSVSIPSDRRVRKALLLAAADDSFSAYVNGRSVGTGRGWSDIQLFDVTGELSSGANVLAIAATNAPSPSVGPDHNPAGLIGVLSVDFENGEPLLVPTDDSWRASEKEVDGWERSTFDDTRWTQAQVCGGLGIGPWGKVGGSNHRRLPARMLRHEFKVTKEVRRATAYVCGLGFFDLYVNGERVGDHLMDPALTGYDRRACYVTFDVSRAVHQGENAIGVVLGNGRYFAPRKDVPVPMTTYGYPKLLLQLRLEHRDGSVENVVSDSDWRLSTSGPIRANNEFDGEEYDARREMPGWSLPGFDDAGWRKTDLVKPPGGALESQLLEPIRVVEVLKPVAMTNPRPGTFLVDFGQSFYGSVRLKVSGPASKEVRLRTSFNVTPEGLLNVANDRSARNLDIYVLKGQGVETWHPRFKANATRYVQVEGFPGTPTVDNFEGLVTHTDMEEVGQFTCSNSLINRIYENARWGTRMQNRSVPMEPDRDERMPWSGHPAKTSESEGFVFNVARFYDHFLHNYRAHQGADGSLQEILPPYWTFNSKDIIWPSVITVIPEWYYNFYGDPRLLADNFDCMKRWVLFQQKAYQKPDYTIDYCNYGDWVDGSWIKGTPDKRTTSRPLMSTAYYYNNCRIVARAARLLGKTEAAEQFSDLAAKVKVGFNARFFNRKTNKYESETQGSYVFPLAFGLVPEEHRSAVVANFVDEIKIKHAGHTSVGLVGMQWFMQTLTDIGHPEVAYGVATQTTRPSWGYMVSKGATTIWERWDTDIQDGGMNGESQKILSGNLEAWLYQTLAGINYDPEKPGFKHIILRPRPVGDLSFVRASHRSLYGPVVSEWTRKGGAFEWTLAVPPNTTATVYVPAEDAAAVTEGDKPAAQAEGVRFLRMEAGSAVFAVGSGTYAFRVPA